MCSHRSSNFETDALTKQLIEWNINDQQIKIDYISNSTKTVKHRKKTLNDEVCMSGVC